MIQDIHPVHFCNHYEPQKPSEADHIICFRDNKFYVHYSEKEQHLIFPKWSELQQSGDAVYLFSLNDEKYFFVQDWDALPDGYEWYDTKELRQMKKQGNLDIFIIYTAWHLVKWYQSSRFCGVCGTKTEFDTAERAMVCPHCGYKIYPRINPAVIVGVTNGDRLLLTKYNHTYAYNALIAGFTEIGETMEETVQREVMEEAGLKVKNIRYYKSQPWGIAADILMGFYCDVDGDDTIHRDDTELKYAEWVKREDIELQPDSLSLTNEMMMMFKQGRF